MATQAVIKGGVRAGGSGALRQGFFCTVRTRANQSKVFFPKSQSTSGTGYGNYQQRRWYSTSSGNQRPSTSWVQPGGRTIGLGIAATAAVCLVAYFFGSYEPTPMPESMMKKVGYDPEANDEECPILVPPPVGELEEMVNTLGSREGEIFAGIVNLARFGRGDKHFYAVVANTGNVFKIAAATGLPVEKVVEVLTSPAGMLLTWGGCMMAGGGAIHLTPEGTRILRELSGPQIERPILRQNPIIGQGELTSGYDYVQLSDPRRFQGQGVILNSFLARTMYFHSLSGSVLHMQLLTAKGDLVWVWVGAGGRGFNSKYVNNPAAIHLDLGMWPDMAKSIRAFYSDPELVKTVVGMDPQEMGKAVNLLVAASQSRKGTFKDVMQRIQVSGGYPTRIKSSIRAGSMYGVKGEGNKND